MFAVGPKFFPGEQFAIVQKKPPEFNEVTVGWPFIGARGADVLIEFFEAFFGALEINAALLGGFLMMLAETRHPR